MANIYRCTAFLVLALILMPGTYAQKKAASLGTIRAIRGRIIISRQVGNSRQEIVALKGMSIYENDEFTSGKGSKAILRMNGGHVIQVGPTSFYRVKLHYYNKKNNVTKSLSKLLYGRMRANVKSFKKTKKSSFEVMTPNAVLGVRGTDFIATFDMTTHTSNVITKEGEVSFKAARYHPKTGKLLQKTKKTILVKSGQQSTVIGSGTTSKMPELSAAESADELYIDKIEREFDEEVGD